MFFISKIAYFTAFVWWVSSVQADVISQEESRRQLDEDKNGKNCSLQASITCKLVNDDIVIDCASIIANVDYCSKSLDVRYLVEYTFTYYNSNSARRKIKFYDSTYASEHGEPVNIGTDIKLKPGESKSFTVQRHIDACDFDLKEYSASIEMRGRITKAKKWKEGSANSNILLKMAAFLESTKEKNRCYAQASYNARIIRKHVDYEHHIDYEPPHIDYEPPHIDYEPPHIDYEPPHIDYEPPHIDYEPPHIDYEPPHIDHEPPHIDYEQP